MSRHPPDPAAALTSGRRRAGAGVDDIDAVVLGAQAKLSLDPLRK
jgi:hypothetical protein